MGSLLEEIHFNDIPVTNLVRSMEWYQSILGFEIGFKNEEMCILKLEKGPVLALNISDGTSRANWSNEGKTKPIVGFTTQTIEVLHSHLRSNGVTVTDIHDEGMGWFFEFIDPDGNMFSVLKYN
ncbi:VOC family protein [Paenibacillus psychroresistens]|uniref:VOC family protein n=1 Tax=Paenibacillus psychroresistens TaxID=1778678 RepID=A0A6B8RL53_9BACL|nr:VOC family protein [Paenibacillus psychroresistens]QGQ96098.1 VOC family protein [Paenibacillus psychroresistens]